MSVTAPVQRAIKSFVITTLFIICFFAGILVLFSSCVLLNQPEALRGDALEMIVVNGTGTGKPADSEDLLYTALDDVIIEKIAPMTPVDYVESIQPR